ncbi:MAG: hypothetical protein ACI4AB_06040 [Acetatifactor sp.]
MKNHKTDKDKILDRAVFAVLLIAVSIVTLVLFYRQTMGNPKYYHSDMKAYILEMQGIGSKYSFPYPIFFKSAAFLNLFTTPELAVALATMLFNGLAIVITKLTFNYLTLGGLEAAIENRQNRLREVGKNSVLKKWMAGAFLSIVAVSLFFISMLYPPTGIYLPGIKFKYLGVFTANPFHNATYMAARPFAILAFLWYGKLLPVYEKGCAGKSAGNVDAPILKDYILFSLFLLLATMTKPSFTIVLVGAAGLIMLYRLFRSKFKNLVPTIQLGLCFIPTFIDLLYQFNGVFVPKEGAEGGIGFCFGEVWANYCTNIPLAVCLAIGFPILVLLLNYKELKRDSLYRFSWQVYLMSFAMAFFLYEKGFRKADFNFSWGYMYGIFFCHFEALLVLLKATAAGAGSKKKALLIGLQWLAYLWHFVCGIFYFGVLMKGWMYY